MTIRFTAVALALLLSLSAARAQEAAYAVVGADLSGRATVEGEAFELRYRTFDAKHPKGIPHALSGRVLARSEDRLEVEVEHGFEARRGLATRVLTPWRGGEARRLTQRITFSAGADGALEGALLALDAAGRPTEEARSLPVRLRPERVATDAVAVLVVPGLSTNIWNQYGVPYLDENLATLEARGLSARRLAVITEESVATNAATIAAEVRREVAAGRRVILIAHSKGGADTLTALADPENRDLLPHVLGLVAIQPVYGGSPIADFMGSGRPVDDLADAACLTVPENVRETARKLVRGIADQAFDKLLPFISYETEGGSPGAWRDLQTSARQASLAAHPYPADRVPTVVVRGYTEGRALVRPLRLPMTGLPFMVVPADRHILRQPLVLFQRYTQQTLGVKTDGMVNLENQSVPGSVAEVTLEDIDHFEPGFRGESPHSPCAITHQGLDLLLDHLASAPAPAAARRGPSDGPLGE